jgi:hypothetical protein
MDATDAFELRKHRMRFGTMQTRAARSLSHLDGWPPRRCTTAIKAETVDKDVHVEPSTLDTGDTTPAASEIAPFSSSSPTPASSVLATAATDGYAERPAQ